MSCAADGSRKTMRGLINHKVIHHLDKSVSRVLRGGTRVSSRKNRGAYHGLGVLTAHMKKSKNSSRGKSPEVNHELRPE